MTALVALFAFVASASAMSYEQARQQALFLTDKMAYELNLTEEQYEAAYEVNLDYLMGVNTQDDLYGIYWERRNLDLSYILLDWQYRLYLDATYFYRPLYWSAGYWHFGIYARYPHRDYFYFGLPRFYSVYRGGHAWHMNGGRSWYHGRSFAPAGRGRNEHFGMHNRFERGDYGCGSRGLDNRGNNRGYNNGNRGNDNRGYGSRGNNRGRDNRSFDQNNRGQRNVGSSAQSRPNNVQPGRSSQPGYSNQNGNFGGSRQSSTRTTVGRQYNGSNRSESTAPRSTFTPSQQRSVQGASPSRSINRSGGSSTVNRSNIHSAPTRSYSTPSRGSSHSSAPSRSISGGSRGGSSHSSGMSGGSRGGGSRGGGGGHFGGRR